MTVKYMHETVLFNIMLYVFYQEQMSSTGFGVMPKAFWVALEDDLVDSCKPGDDVAITLVESKLTVLSQFPNPK